jgi:hypothetical protein
MMPDHTKGADTPTPTHKEGDLLLKSIKNNLKDLKDLLQDCNSHWGGEDSFYRFYHGSLKVYWIQKKTEKILGKIRKISAESGLESKGINKQFLTIMGEGTNKTFDLSHNENWDKHTRPILEAFFHAREMLAMMVKYGDKLETAPNMLPSGWAAVLYLFNIR